MRYHYSLVPEDEPIYRDMPVYNSTILYNGELLMLGTTDPDSAADQGISLVNAYVSDSANEAVDAVGILQESTYESTAPSRTAVNTSGVYYGKVIINPLAVYLAEYYQGTGNDVAISSTSSTTVTVTALEDDIDAGWVFFPLSATGVKNSLRFLTASAAGSATMDSALTVSGTSNDTIIKILPPNHRLTALEPYARGLDSVDAKAGSGTFIHIMDNYIESDGHSMQPLRYVNHAGLNNLSNAKFYADICLLDHIYKIQG